MNSCTIIGQYKHQSYKFESNGLSELLLESTYQISYIPVDAIKPQKIRPQS